MSLSRIIAVVVIAALLLVAGLTVYNARQTTTLAANTANSYNEQRMGEWRAGGSHVEPKLDQHERHVK